MERSDSLLQAKEALNIYLQRKGMRRTQEREMLLDAIWKMSGHFTPENLRECMAVEIKFPVSRATVYNNMELLVRAGIIVRHQFHDTVLYERCFNSQTHVHLICRECGKVMEIPDADLARRMEGIKARRFSVLSYSLYLWGLCSRCAAPKRVKNNDKDKPKHTVSKNGRKKD